MNAAILLDTAPCSPYVNLHLQGRKLDEQEIRVYHVGRQALDSYSADFHP
jgi:hypothetical protein